MAVENFKASDETGKVYEIVVTQSQINTSTLAGQASIPGIKSFRLSTGEALNRLSESTFAIVGSKTVLTRV